MPGGLRRTADNQTPQRSLIRTPRRPSPRLRRNGRRTSPAVGFLAQVRVGTQARRRWRMAIPRGTVEDARIEAPVLPLRPCSNTTDSSH